MADAQGPELRELADTLREAGTLATTGPWVDDRGSIYSEAPRQEVACGGNYLGGQVSAADAALMVLLRNNLPTIISALERAAAAEGEKAEAWDLRGGALRLSREEWGVVTDALIQHRGHADDRKAGNSESTSDVRADMCADLIRRIGEAAS